MAKQEITSKLDSCFSFNQENALLHVLDFKEDQRACLAIEHKTIKQQAAILFIYRAATELTLHDKQYRNDIFSKAIAILAFRPTDRLASVQSYVIQHSLITSLSKQKTADTPPTSDNQTDYQWCQQFAKEMFKRHISFNGDPDFSANINKSSRRSLPHKSKAKLNSMLRFNHNEQAMLYVIQFGQDEHACLALEYQNAKGQMNLLIMYKNKKETLALDSSLSISAIHRKAAAIINLEQTDSTPSISTYFIKRIQACSLADEEADTSATEPDQSDLDWCKKFAQDKLKVNILINAAPAFADTPRCSFTALCLRITEFFKKCIAYLCRCIQKRNDKGVEHKVVKLTS